MTNLEVTTTYLKKFGFVLRETHDATNGFILACYRNSSNKWVPWLIQNANEEAFAEWDYNDPLSPSLIVSKARKDEIIKNWTRQCK